MRKADDGFSANEEVQQVYQVIGKVIAGLSNERAISVLEEVCSQAEMMIEALREELYEEEGR